MKWGVVAVAILILGCTPVSPGGDEEVEPVSLAAETGQGRAVDLLLRNDTRKAIGYNLCVSSLQRREDGRWSHVETGDVCTMDLRSLESGESATYEKTLPADLGSGEYRYVTSVESPLGETPKAIPSASFEVD